MDLSTRRDLDVAETRGRSERRLKYRPSARRPGGTINSTPAQVGHSIVCLDLILGHVRVIKVRHQTEIIKWPIGEPGLTDNIFDFDSLEDPGVLTVPPIVAHHVNHAFGHGIWRARVSIALGDCAFDVRLIELFAVDVNVS